MHVMNNFPHHTPILRELSKALVSSDPELEAARTSYLEHFVIIQNKYIS